jgi:phospholipid/cholesterol/gamma-HCH transport system ATP-binding protein
MAGDDKARISVRHLTMAFGSFVVMRDLNFEVRRGSIVFIMGGSGCGKSTLLRHMIGLNEPAEGEVFYEDVNFTRSSPEEREQLLRRVGVLYQSGALWSSMTLGENVGLPLGEFTSLSPAEIEEVATLKLALVGLKGFEDYFPSEISGGMQKRAGLARAMALDPDILFLDEPSAGLDPISSRMLDELIVGLRDSLGATIIIVSHELASILSIGDDCVFLDIDERTITARGRPRDLLEHSDNANVRRFLTRAGSRDGPGAGEGAAT